MFLYVILKLSLLAEVVVVTHTIHSPDRIILTVNVLPTMLQLLSIHKIGEFNKQCVESVRKFTLSQEAISRALSVTWM